MSFGLSYNMRFSIIGFTLTSLLAILARGDIAHDVSPHFWIGHVDMTSLQQPITEAKQQLGEYYGEFTGLFQNITSTIFIAQIDGRAFGAGNELAVQMDLPFVGPGAKTGPFENALGLVAGGGGEVFPGSLIGKAKALESLLQAKTFDGPTGEALGIFNKYYGTSEELESSVLEMAKRMALFPRGGLNETKSVLNSFLNSPQSALQQDFEAGLLRDGAVGSGAGKCQQGDQAQWELNGK